MEKIQKQLKQAEAVQNRLKKAQEVQKQLMQTKMQISSWQNLAMTISRSLQKEMQKQALSNKQNTLELIKSTIWNISDTKFERCILK